MVKRSSQLTILAAAKNPQAVSQFLEPLNALDCFVQELQRCDQADRQLRLVLRTVADAIHADAVCLVSLMDSKIFECVGRVEVKAEWCRNIVQQLLEAGPSDRSQILHFPVRSDPSDEMSAPTSAALVQISKSRKSWVVALQFDHERELQPADLKLMVLTRRLLLNHSRQLQAAERLKETLFGLIHCLTAAIDAKDPYTCGHSERVARIASRLGQAMNLPEATLSDLYLAGLLHDVGKIGIEDHILRKPGELTEEETGIIQEHPVIGDRIIASVRPLAHLRPGVRNHHERYDGRGYPDRLAALDIPLMARILAVADSCDAMMAARPYRPFLPPAKIEAVFADGAGTQWDPQVVEAFTSCRKELYGIGQRGIGDSLMAAVGHAVHSTAGADHSVTGNIVGREDGSARFI